MPAVSANRYQYILMLLYRIPGVLSIHAAMQQHNHQIDCHCDCPGASAALATHKPRTYVAKTNCRHL